MTEQKGVMGQDDDWILERCNELERLLKCIWEEACTDYEDEKVKCSVSSALIGEIKKLIEEN